MKKAVFFLIIIVVLTLFLEKRISGYFLHSAIQSNRFYSSFEANKLKVFKFFTFLAIDLSASILLIALLRKYSQLRILYVVAILVLFWTVVYLGRVYFFA